MSTKKDNNLASALQSEDYKIIIIGNLGTGKTSLLLRFVYGTFEERVSRFVSEEKKVVRVGGKEMTLDLWDTAGQERFQSITNRFYSDTNGVIILYDVASEESFRDLDFWIKELNHYLPQELDSQMPVLFVGNKKDLIDRNDPSQEIVDRRAVKEIAHAYAFMDPIECSAKTGECVNKVFETMAAKLWDCRAKKLGHGNGSSAPKVNVTKKGRCSC